MDEDKVRQIVQDEIQTNLRGYNADAQFQVVPIPAHVHNGVDSNQIDASTITNLVFPKINRVSSYTTTGTPTPNASLTDLFNITGATGSVAFQTPIGNPANGQILIIRITSSNSATARSITFATAATGGYIASSPALPSATTTGQTLMLGFMYDTTGSLNRWRLFQSASA